MPTELGKCTLFSFVSRGNVDDPPGTLSIRLLRGKRVLVVNSVSSERAQGLVISYGLLRHYHNHVGSTN